jgi:hypothetical protein
MFLTALIIIIIIIIIIGLTKLGRMRWVEDVTRIREKINAFWFVVGKRGESKPL